MEDQPIKNPDCLYIIGDSFVVGWGQDDDKNKEVNHYNRFSSLLSKNLKLNEINKGVAGCSNEYIFRQTIIDIGNLLRNNIKPLVICVYTDVSRKELYCNKSSNLNSVRNFIKDYHVNHYDNLYSYQHSISLIAGLQSFLKINNVNYVEISSLGSRDDIKEYDENNLIDNTNYFFNIEEVIGYNRFHLDETKPLYNGHPTALGHRLIAEKLEEILINRSYIK
jgi:hypothetical protein